jgi:undecaprenyl-diphosphatase
MNQIYEIFVAIVVGATEGFTEFLPISSTAHNGLVAQFLLGGKDIGLDVSNIFQFGALVAIVQFFWKDLSSYFYRLVNVVKSLFYEFVWSIIVFLNLRKLPRQPEVATPSRKGNFEGKQFIGNIQSWLGKKTEDNDFFEIDTTIAQITIATIPTSIIGLLMRKQLDSLRGLMFIGFFLIIGSMLMGVADWYYQKNKSKQNPNKVITPIDAFNIGLFQTMGIFPGISRSGATLSGAFFMGVDRVKAVRFGFLVGIPILALAGIKDGLSVISKIKDHPFLPSATQVVTSNGEINMSLVSILIGSIVSYFVAMASLKWLLKYLATHNFTPFIIYRVIFGVILLVLSAGVK